MCEPTRGCSVSHVTSVDAHVRGSATRLAQRVLARPLRFGVAVSNKKARLDSKSRAMDVVYGPGGENMYQVGGSRGGVVVGALLQDHMADDGKRA